ncbi:MAG: HAD family acid phosphatase [Acidimicrobiales bacterium]
MSLPSTWQWRVPEDQQGRPAAPCVIVDIDGVLADGAHRQHLVKAKRWREFFDAANADLPIAETAVLLRLLDPDLVVVLLTGRPIRTREATVTWLADHGYRWDLLVMKEDGDMRKATWAKREAVNALREAGYTPVLALDDEPGNVTMYREEKIPCLYIHSGYYE